MLSYLWQEMCLSQSKNVYEMELKAPFLLTFTFNSWTGNCMSEFMGLICGKYEAKVST